MRAAYSISALILTCLAPLLLVLSAYALLVSKPVLHLAVGPYDHYELSMRWVGGWALGAAFLSWCGRIYCRGLLCWILAMPRVIK